MNTTIAFFDAKQYDIKFFDKANENYGFTINYFSEKLNPRNARLAEGAEIVCAFVNDIINEEVIDALVEQGVKLLALRCAGYNNVDLHYAQGKIKVVRVPAYSPYAVAEHALALIMTLNRKTHRAYYRIRDNNFSINGFLGFDMHGKTAGIIGTGRIGKIMVKILKGLGMKVLCYDNFPDKVFAKEEEIDYVSLDEIFRNSDIISLHCPLTEETKHIINDESLHKVKPTAMIINISRGQLIDTKALIQALKENRIGSAGLDVYEEEEDFFFEDYSGLTIQDDVLARLLTFNNVLVTSHQGFFTEEALETIAEITLFNSKEFIDGATKLENEICARC